MDPLFPFQENTKPFAADNRLGPSTRGTAEIGARFPDAGFGASFPAVPSAAGARPLPGSEPPLAAPDSMV